MTALPHDLAARAADANRILRDGVAGPLANHKRQGQF